MEAKLQQMPQKAQASKPNLTGIPTQMKLDFEQRSGLSFDDVRVHYNSDKPAKLQALAYTQGTQVYVGPRQERHLPHELGHVVQQKMGIVNQTSFRYGFPVNDDPALERAADTNRIPSKRGASKIPIIQGCFIIKDGKIHHYDKTHTISVRCYYLGVAKNGLNASKYVFTAPHIKQRFYSDGSDINNQDEPQYEISKDITAIPYLKSNEMMFGETELRSSIMGTKAHFEEKKIRVNAKKVTDRMKAGAGLHEIIPTNMLQYIHQIDDHFIRAIFFGFMGGLRTSTDKTFFVLYEKGEPFVIGHTGAFPNPYKAGSQGTEMQDILHDYMRDFISEELIDFSNPQISIVAIMNMFFELLAKEDDIRKAKNITGLYPNILYTDPSTSHPPIPMPLEPPGTTANRRKALGRCVAISREYSKFRGREIARRLRTQSPSPERLPSDEEMSGNYQRDSETGAWVNKFTGIPFIITTPPPKFISFPRTISNIDDCLTAMKYVADVSGFVTRPFRHVPDPSMIPKRKPRAAKPKYAASSKTVRVTTTRGTLKSILEIKNKALMEKMKHSIKSHLPITPISKVTTISRTPASPHKIPKKKKK